MRAPGAGTGSARTKLLQLFNARKLHGEPAIRFPQDWTLAVRSICEHWMRHEERDGPSLVALSRMRALDYERRNLQRITPGARLFPHLETTPQFYDAQIRAFLEAVGEPVDEVLESFRHVGQGFIHRKNAIGIWGAKGVLTTARRLVPEPATKAALSATELLLELCWAYQAIASGDKRLYTAQAEEVMPLGKADASPSARGAPTIFQASRDVIARLGRADKTVRELFAAVDAAEAARSACLRKQSSGEAGLADAKKELQQARDALDLLFARHSHHVLIRSSYKASFESLKKEFWGNAGYFTASSVASALTLGAGLLAILTPVVISATVTGGITAGALGLAILIYLAYHFSNGPSKDGERKAKRQIVALAKCTDMLERESGLPGSEGMQSAVRARAQSHVLYRKELKEIRRLPRGERTRLEEEAKQRHLARLRTIAKADRGSPAKTARQNWEAFGQYQRKPAAGENPASANDEFESALRQEGTIRASVAAKAWKPWMRMSMEAARRLTTGKIADLHERLLDLKRHRFSVRRAFAGSEKLRKKEHELREELRQAIFDAMNLELALHRMASARNRTYATPEQRRHALVEACERCAPALEAVQDEDVRKLFTGNAQEQMTSRHRSKLLSLGERDRYVYPNAANAVGGIAIGTAIGGVNLTIQDLKMQAAAAGADFPYHYNDHEFARIMPAGANAHSPHNASARDRYKTSDAARLAAQIDDAGRNGKCPPKNHTDARMQIGLEDDGRAFFSSEDRKAVAEVERFLAALLEEHAVPRSIMLVGRPAAGTSADPGRDLTLDFMGTEAYYRSAYRNLPAEHGLPGKERLKVSATKVRTLARHALVGIGGLVVQPFANINLKNTSASFKEAADRRPEIESLLRQEGMFPDQPPVIGVVPDTGQRLDEWKDELERAIGGIASAAQDPEFVRGDSSGG